MCDVISHKWSSYTLLLRGKSKSINYFVSEVLYVCTLVLITSSVEVYKSTR